MSALSRTPSASESLIRPAAAARLVACTGAYVTIALFDHAQPFAALSALSVLLLGFLLSTLLPAMHEATHGHLGRSRALNAIVGRLAGLLLTVNYSLYRRYHLTHHARLGEPDDPELPVELHGIGSYLLHLTPYYLLLPFWRQQLQIALGERPAFARHGARPAARAPQIRAPGLILNRLGTSPSTFLKSLSSLRHHHPAPLRQLPRRRSHMLRQKPQCHRPKIA